MPNCLTPSSHEKSPEVMNIYLSITPIGIKIERCNWHQCVCLIKAHSVILWDITYFSELDFDLRSNLYIDLIKS